MIWNEAYWIHLATRAVEIAGTAIIVTGAFGALALFLLRQVNQTLVYPIGASSKLLPSRPVLCCLTRYRHPKMLA